MNMKQRIYVFYCFSDVEEARPRNRIFAQRHTEKFYALSVETIEAEYDCFDGDWSPRYLPDDIPYSVSSCEAEIIVEEYFYKRLKCAPALYKNPGGLPICSTVELARQYLAIGVDCVR